MSTELCSMEPERRASATSLHDFVIDRSVRSVYGPRRMGRGSLAESVMQAASEAGISVSLYPDVSGDMVVSIDPVDPIPGKDVIFTVDLCHQTVAAMRVPDRM